MVKLDYLLDQPPTPDAIKTLIDQRVIPKAIDAAAGVERFLETAARATRARPARAVALAIACGALANRLLRSRR
jgi:hypothetical protein